MIFCCRSWSAGWPNGWCSHARGWPEKSSLAISGSDWNRFAKFFHRSKRNEIISYVFVTLWIFGCCISWKQNYQKWLKLRSKTVITVSFLLMVVIFFFALIMIWHRCCFIAPFFGDNVYVNSYVFVCCLTCVSVPALCAFFYNFEIFNIVCVCRFLFNVIFSLGGSKCIPSYIMQFFDCNCLRFRHLFIYVPLDLYCIYPAAILKLVLKNYLTFL